jgi:hypothetical protein
MATHLLALPEILAMLEVVGVPAKHVEAFRSQAQQVLDLRAPLTRGDEYFEVASGYSHAKNTGHVKFKTGTLEHQFDPKKAKQIGHWLVEAAEAAIADQVAMTLLREKVGITDATRLGAILLDLREIRQGTRDVVFEQ